MGEETHATALGEALSATETRAHVVRSRVITRRLLTRSTGLMLVDPVAIMTVSVEGAGVFGSLVGCATVDALGWVWTRRIAWRGVSALAASCPLVVFLF